jgi:hypothetical protein
MSPIGRMRTSSSGSVFEATALGVQTPISIGLPSPWRQSPC